ncbi:venom prothrombin activator pseutarin-C catalytic subunit-like [Hypanus sabinus]|uniref:venom prothrombin activator pseutarin-C catalytic subunit-like n=1 Tax=Hypanus sabinus TaxID=79690 RepID=UPI0028C41727|nr:venom prothrombin activator pseutarin-C catalytic subunit-like [Hypanus sabinus]
MKLVLSYGIILLLLTGCHTNDVFLQKPSALQLLSHIHRESLEQECVVETCSKEEIHEIFEDDSTTEFFWKIYIDRLKCNSTTCQSNGICQNTFMGIQCKCLGGFNGTFCEIDINECDLMLTCPPGTTCVDGINNFTCICPAEGCYANSEL